MRPHIGAVVGHKDRNVADDLNAVTMGVIFHRLPLAEEKKLTKLLRLHRVGILLSCRLQRLRLPTHQIIFPSRPHRAVVTLLQRHEQSKVIQPRRIFLLERFKLVAQNFRAFVIGIHRIKQRQLVLNDGSIIHVVIWKIRNAIQIRSAQQTLCQKFIGADQIRVTGKRRETLIRRIAKPRWTQRKYLPQFLIRARQKIYPAKRLLAQIANAVATG